MILSAEDISQIVINLLVFISSLTFILVLMGIAIILYLPNILLISNLHFWWLEENSSKKAKKDNEVTSDKDVHKTSFLRTLPKYYSFLPLLFQMFFLFYVIFALFNMPEKYIKLGYFTYPIALALFFYFIKLIGITIRYIQNKRKATSHKKIRNKEKSSFINSTKIKCFFLFCIFAYCSLACSTPLIIILQYFSNNDSVPYFIFISMATLALLYLPVILYFAEYIFPKSMISSKGEHVCVAAIAAFLCLFFLLMIAPSSFKYINYKALHLSGIANSTPHTYLVNEKNYTFNDFNTEIWHTTQHPNNSNKIYIRAVPAIRIGANILLCPLEFTDLMDKIFLKLEDVTKEIDRFRTSNQKCLFFTQNEVIQWDSFEIETNKPNPI